MSFVFWQSEFSDRLLDGVLPLRSISKRALIICRRGAALDASSTRYRLLVTTIFG